MGVGWRRGNPSSTPAPAPKIGDCCSPQICLVNSAASCHRGNPGSCLPCRALGLRPDFTRRCLYFVGRKGLIVPRINCFVRGSIPQGINTWKRKKTRERSREMTSFFVYGCGGNAHSLMSPHLEANGPILAAPGAGGARHRGAGGVTGGSGLPSSSPCRGLVRWDRARS